MLTTKSLITYGKMEIDGVKVRPDSKHVVQKAIQGHPVEVHSGTDYINLYHIFERLKQSNKSLARLCLVRKQIGQSVWQLFITADRTDVPEVTLRDGYDPRRGRYKRYANQLAAGESLLLPTKTEAIKARRAWQLYVASDRRRHQRPTIRKITTGFTVEILDRSKSD